MSDKYDVEKMLNRLVDDDKKSPDDNNPVYSWQKNSNYREKNTKNMSVDDLVQEIAPDAIKPKMDSIDIPISAHSVEQTVSYRDPKEVQTEIDKQDDTDSKTYLNNMLDRMEKELNPPLKPKVVTKTQDGSEAEDEKVPAKPKKIVKLRAQKKNPFSDETAGKTADFNDENMTENSENADSSKILEPETPSPENFENNAQNSSDSFENESMGDNDVKVYTGKDNAENKPAEDPFAIYYNDNFFDSDDENGGLEEDDDLEILGEGEDKHKKKKAKKSKKEQRKEAESNLTDDLDAENGDVTEAADGEIAHQRPKKSFFGSLFSKSKNEDNLPEEFEGEGEDEDEDDGDMKIFDKKSSKDFEKSAENLDKAMEKADSDIENLNDMSEEEREKFNDEIFALPEKDDEEESGIQVDSLDKNPDFRKSSKNAGSDDDNDISPAYDPKYFYFGIFISILAAIGIIFLIIIGTRAALGNTDKSSLKNDVLETVYPDVVMDIDAFDSPAALSDQQKIGASIINIIMYSDKEKYKSEAGNITIPQADVEKSAKELFGNAVTITKHQNVAKDNVTFYYNDIDKTYRVASKPLIYSSKPIVNKVTAKGDTYIAEILYTLDYPDYIEDSSKNKITFYKVCEYTIKKDAAGNYYTTKLEVRQAAQ